MQPKSRTELAKEAIAAKKAEPVKRLTSPDTITHTCGHTRTPTELKSVKCSVCMEQDRIRAEARKRAKANEVRQFKGRLPKGSTFALAWDGEKWFGTLAVPEVGHWNGEGPTLFGLEMWLDEQYRQAVKAKAEEVKP